MELAEKIQNMDSSKLPQFDHHTCLADQPEAEAPWQENLTTFEDPLQSKPAWGKNLSSDVKQCCLIKSNIRMENQMKERTRKWKVDT